MSPSYQRIRQVVSKIPKGRVMTYGDVALAAGMPGAARVVGYAMHSLGGSVPWQRVLGRRNARSGHLTIKDPQTRARQRQLLEQEGVRFSASGAIDLVAFGWAPRARALSSTARARKKGGPALKRAR
jgi:methylated-DNA-protein-cysteine methyltransferase-like protein